MSTHFDLTANVRSDLRKGASRRLRREEQIPAIIYGAQKPTQTIALSHREVAHALQQEAFFASILTLTIAGKKEKAILKDLQRHPYKPRILHIDFQRINENEKLTMHIPLHFLHEDSALGVKNGGIVSKQMTDVEIKCLPADLPEYIEVDVANLDIDGTIHLREINLPEGVELAHAVHDDAHDHAVVSIIMPRAVVEEVEAPVVPAASDVPAAAQKAEAEGDKAKDSDKAKT